MARILGIGESFPPFSLQACVSLEKGHEFREIDYKGGDGRWKVIFFWPHDFTFVCPTEIAEFNRSLGDFTDRDTDLFGASTDSHFVHLAWRQSHDDLRDLKFPMLADYKKELSEALGILHPTEKVPLRATYIVDPHGIVRWVSVNDMKVGRNVKEVVRILDALQTDELCPCNWQPGEAVLQVA
jgi:peroxiredoxin (alkyl hydroperoxide reductase subunit C)